MIAVTSVCDRGHTQSRGFPRPTHITLNERGETVETLSRVHDRAYLTRQLLEWMERTARRLETEIAEQSSPGGDQPA